MIQVSPEVQYALKRGVGVVALESTLIAHGLPYPVNLEVARESEAAVRASGAIPATVAIIDGVPTVGLSPKQLEELATTTGVLKVSRRDLGVAIVREQLAATTVSGTLAIAAEVGIKVFATGGIGGAHRPPANVWDISADVSEIARSKMLTVCAGAKNLLDLPRTLELLESAGVPVLGFRTDTFPEFYTRGGTLPVSARVDHHHDVASICLAQMFFGTGTLLCQPLPEADAIDPDEFSYALAIAENRAEAQGITGARLTPFLLAQLAELTEGRTLVANRKLIVNNARLAAEVALHLR
jgi:pseudouridine-5'-phosphate glycosidase